LVLIVFFILEGVATIMYAIDHRRQLSGRWAFMLASGVIDLLLAAIILAGLPETAAWAIGLLVGINLIFGGSAMLAMAARKLDPPRMKSRRWPRVLAGTALLAGCAAAATAMAMRKNTRMMRSMQPSPMPSGSPSSSTTEAQSAGLNPKAEAERARREAEVNGLSRTTTR